MTEVHLRFSIRTYRDEDHDEDNDQKSIIYYEMCHFRVYRLISTRRYARLSYQSCEIAYWFTPDTTATSVKILNVDVNPVRVVRLFYLQDTLRPEAENLKTVFSLNDTVNPERIVLLTFNDLTALMDPDDPSSQPYSDVVVILGHSNVFSFGLLAITDILRALLHPKPPSFVVFLGCCGGNPRYGPLKMMSLLPEWRNTIFGFFRRRIYKDELCQSVPVLAIKHYLYLHKLGIPIAESKMREKNLVSYSISCAYSEAYLKGYKCDSECFLNPSIELSPAQEFFGVVRGKIPPSCQQLVMYHNFTTEKQNEFKEFVAITVAGLRCQFLQYYNAEDLNEKLIAEVDKRCKAELKRQKLSDIIELSCEIQFLQVTEVTFALLRNNRWEEIDHLQFFVVMLHGYWGRNYYNSLMELAMYHLRELMKLTYISPSEENLHQYHLCCVGFCLFSPEVNIKFADGSNQFPEMYKYFVQVHHHIIVPALCIITALPINENELPWVDAFYLRKKDRGFVELFDKKRHFPMHSFRRDKCGCGATPVCKYEYTKEDLMKALETLKDYLDPLSDKSTSLYESYRIKQPFHNEDNDRNGYMKCFPLDINYVEMRVIQDPRALKMQNTQYINKWNKVSRCRFVFAYSQVNDQNIIKGNLYFTDSHYGEDKIKKKALIKKWISLAFTQFKDKKFEIVLEKIVKQLLQDNCKTMDYSKLLSKESISTTESEYKERVKLLKTIATKLQKMNYFDLFNEVTKQNRNAILYNLQKELLKDTRDELVKELDAEFKNNFTKLLSKGKKKKAHPVHKRDILLQSVTEISEQSVKQLLSQKTLQEVVESWSSLENEFIESINGLAQKKQLSMVIPKSEIITVVRYSIKIVRGKSELFKEGFYPFVEIGELTLGRGSDPRLK